MVYGRFVDGHLGSAPGTLHVMTTSGARNALGQVPPLVADTVQLAGSMIVLLDARHPHAVRWWNLATDTSGATTMKSDEYPRGASPEGWLYLQRSTFENSGHLEERTTDGTTYANSDTWGAGVPVVSAHRLLMQNRAGATAVMTWAHRGRFTRLVSASFVRKHFPGGSVTCGSMDSKAAACVGRTSNHSTMLVMPLDGSRVRHRHLDCTLPASLPIAYGGAAIWANTCNGRLKRLGADGGVTTLIGHYGVEGVWHGLGSVLALSKSARTLYALHGGHGKPTVLLRAG